jgi:phosphoribosylformimino-5-aminoimidazole carboxamide ribotide isomerase
VQVIGVVDLLAGRAVHARAGTRETYQPVQAIAGSTIEPGDAVELARAYVNEFGVTGLYVADLDRILGRRGVLSSAEPARLSAISEAHDALVRELVALGAPVWLDRAIASVSDARHAIELGASRVVIGLETLPSYEILAQVSADLGRARVVFSLDLSNGEPIVDGRVAVDIQPGETAHLVAARAVNAGVGAVIVIDVARVGTDAGPDFGLIASVREATRGIGLLAGGGVRGPDDLARLAEVGCDGVLVATALQDGRLSAADVAAAQRIQP